MSPASSNGLSARLPSWAVVVMSLSSLCVSLYLPRTAVVDGLVRSHERRVGVLVGGRVVVAVVAGEVRAGHVDPNAMSGQECIRRGIHADDVFDHLAGLKQFGLIQALSIPCPDHARADIPCQAIGRNVDKSNEPIGVGRRRGRVELDDRVARRLRSRLQRIALVDEDVFTLGRGTPIGGNDRRERAGKRKDGVVGIVNERITCLSISCLAVCSYGRSGPLMLECFGSCLWQLSRCLLQLGQHFQPAVIEGVTLSLLGHGFTPTPVVESSGFDYVLNDWGYCRLPEAALEDPRRGFFATIESPGISSGRRPRKPSLASRTSRRSGWDPRRPVPSGSRPRTRNRTGREIPELVSFPFGLFPTPPRCRSPSGSHRARQFERHVRPL